MISHAYCAGRAAEMLGRHSGQLSLVICQLGLGRSATAVRNGTAVATTMGFTPLDGLMMGSHPGSIEPGILLYLQRSCGIAAEKLDDLIHHGSGLLGVSGISSDYRRVQAAAQSGNERARPALELSTDKVRSAIGALDVTLGRIDALVFTAGVGENSASLRSRVCRGLECLGLKLDDNLNASSRPDADIADGDASARILVLQCRQEIMIAREAVTFRDNKLS